MSHLSQSSAKIAEYPVSIFQGDGIVAVAVNHTILLACEKIDADGEWQKLLNFEPLRAKNRVASLQLNLPGDDWPFIQSQHHSLARVAGLSIPHFCLPIPSFSKDSPPISEFTQTALDKLILQFNTEAWSIYCKWASEEMENRLRDFKPEDSEEYQLQARLEDFLHEVRSQFLFDLEQALISAMRSQDAATDEESFFEMEKAVASCRYQLQEFLATQANLLGLIVEGISIIQEMHPELDHLQMTCKILHRLMTRKLDWWQQLLLLHLLDQQLGVIPIINCQGDEERAHVVLAYRLALAELSTKRLPSEMISLQKTKEIQRLVLANYQGVFGRMKYEV